jgi:hypothetical protein
MFRYPHPELEINAFNTELMDEIHKDGRVFLSSTIVNDQVWIRVAVLCFRTHLSTVDLCLEMIADCIPKAEKALMPID